MHKKLTAPLALAALLAALTPLHGEPTESLESLLPDQPYHRKTDQTAIFSRAQFKYTLNADDHLNRYVDRPLFLTPAHDDPETHFRHAVELSEQYGLDGLAFFPANGASRASYDFAQKLKDHPFRLLTEIYPSKDQTAHIAQAIQLPNSMRIDGKVLISSYNARSAKREGWQKIVADLQGKFPAQTLIIPDMNNFGGIGLSAWITKFNEGSITKTDIENAKEDVRAWLRTSDGIYYSSGEILRQNDRTFHKEFYEKFIIRLYKSVLAEEEFQGKYLGLVGKLGHENHTRMGYTLSSNGTRTLRNSMDAALAAQPDYINLPEWDELNESTCLMPTVFDGRTTMRIMRFYTAKSKNTPLTPIAGDDISIPNLILSYRKLLVAGELIQLELVNVPDSDASTAYTASVRLKDLQGNTVYESEKFAFTRDTLQEHRVILPSESLLAHQLLLPELEVIEGEKTSRFSEGLQALHLRATWNWDYKWVKHSIRELLNVKEATFSLTPVPGEDTLQAVASIEAEEPLAVFELLENDNPIYLHAKENGDQWRENDQHVVLSFTWKSEQGWGKPLLLKGSIALKGATGQWMRMSHPGENGVDESAIQGQTFVLDGQRSNIWQRRVLLSIPREQVKDAVLTVQLGEQKPEELHVQDLLEKDAYGVAGEKSLNLVISRFLRQLHYPQPLDTDKASFSVRVWPESPSAVYHVRAIGKSGKIYRSEPISLLSPSEDTKQIAFFSDSTGKQGIAEVASARVPDIQYEFSPKHGDLLTTKAGRVFWGVLGSFTTLITERGASPGDGSTFLEAGFDYPESAPKWTPLTEGGYALQFNGNGSFITFPQGTIPRRGGYRIEMEISCNESTGKLPLIANYSSRFGTLAVFLEEGELKADYLPDLQNLRLIPINNIASGIKVPANEWTKVTIIYDQQTLTLEAGGKTFTHPVRGPGAHDVVSAFGYYQKNWFKGKIKSLRITHKM